ncbi:hypothetical protein HYW21_03030 [Candidatus Woesearchaeota archaeon]|nr:hypothetical protein [Candidatus Woesearchaeota archaeon]
MADFIRVYTRHPKQYFSLLLFGMILLVSNLPFTHAELMLNEIMYNPSTLMGDDSDVEWVELYYVDPLYPLSNNSLNLSAWELIIGGKTTTLEGDLASDSYVIVARELHDGSDVDNDSFLSFYGENLSAIAIDGYWDYLSNEEGTIILQNPSQNISLTGTYTDALGADGNGNSLEYANETFFESLTLYGTPGYQNSVLENLPGFNQTNETNESNETNETTSYDLELSISLDNLLSSNVSYDHLFTLTNLVYQEGDQENITVTVNYTVFNSAGEQERLYESNFTTHLLSVTNDGTGNYTFPGEGNYTLCGRILYAFINETNPLNETNLSNNEVCQQIIVLHTILQPCDISLTILTPKDLYFTNESLEFTPTLNNESFLFTIEYWIEDLFGMVVKSPYNTSNTNQKSWTPDEEQINVYRIKARLVMLACNDSFLDDNVAEKRVIVQGEKPFSPVLEVEDIMLGSDEEAAFGEDIPVKLSISRGNSTKSSIDLWVEDSDQQKVSTVSSVRVYDSYTTYKVTVPVQLKPNCDDAFPDTNYTLKIEGLNGEINTSLVVHGKTSSLCPSASCPQQQSCGNSPSSSTSSFAPPPKDLSFEVLTLPDHMILETPFSTKIRITNSGTLERTATLWSYAYRGNKAYSGEREANKQETIIKPGGQVTLVLTNTIVAAEPGIYQFKVKYKKDDQKTENDLITTNITLAENLQENALPSPSVSITDFYTRHRKFADEITLYVALSSPEITNVTVVVEGVSFTNATSVLVNGTEIIAFPAFLYPGKNVFFTTVFDSQNISLGFQRLVLFANETTIKTLNESEVLYLSKDDGNSLTNTFTGSGLPQITGSVTGDSLVYESTTAKAKTMVLPLLIVVLALISVTLAWKFWKGK